MRKPFLVTLILLYLCTGTQANSPDKWHDDFYPYRIKLSLLDHSGGPVSIQITPENLIAKLKAISPDPVDLKEFSFEKVILVAPLTQKIVGGFKLVVQKDNMIVDSKFETLGSEKSAWSGFSAAEVKRKKIDLPGRTLSTITVTKSTITNSRLSQLVQLVPDRFYRFGYLRYNDTTDNAISVRLDNPKKRLFAELPASYIPALSPNKLWTHCDSLVLANVAEVSLNISTAYIGTAGVSDIKLQQACWELIATIPSEVKELYLYYVPRAGHMLTCPDDTLVLESIKKYIPVPVILSPAEQLNVNQDGILVMGKFLNAWTIPSEYPVKAGFIKALKPDPDDTPAAYRVNLCQGGDSSFLIAIETATPHAQFTVKSDNLPVQARIHQLAPIPVFDGSFPEGRLTEIRYDAMLDLNDPLCPPAPNGIHVLVVTLTAGDDCQTGTFNGPINITVQTSVPDTESFEIPVELVVAPIAIKPMDHFGVIFAGQHFQVRYEGPPFTKPSTTITDFHGFAQDNTQIDSVARLTATDQNIDVSNSLQTLVNRYYHRMIDFDVQPQILTLYHDYQYKIQDQEGNKAPILSDWDFTEYDKGIDEFLVGRKVPWLPVFHSNGDIMHKLRLNNGTIYSLKPDPENKLSKQVSETEYFRLVGDYFDAVAKHLSQKGCLDKTIYIIDESSPSSYELIYKYRQTLKQRKYASKIKFAHTTYKTSTYLSKTPQDVLYMDEALDIPMPDNDEHFNFFEPSYNERFKKPKNTWVYYVETDHLNLINSGISTIITPLKLKHFGANGWYCWASFIWSLPYPVEADDGWEFTTGPVVNPWLNPFYHHGPGMLSFFYPPDPRGMAAEPTFKIVPSYRLSLIRDGIQARALLEVLSAGKDDMNQILRVDQEKLNLAQAELNKMWADNPVQWYVSYGAYRKFSDLLFEAIRN